ncbi:BTAD domain-containing putative transcriptional regulator [Arthrobacter sp. TMP15]|uniref:AfsR/SARP family transcriptional regulator n=1 Tax=Arthrobacter sp. TMP15 TaxID=3140789 RepID=UPI0031BB897C
MNKLGICVLGPIRAEIQNHSLHLSKARHREIIGILVAARGRTVSTARLIEELWEDAPAGAVGAVRTFIGELRRILEPERPPRMPPSIIVTIGEGYALTSSLITVDLWCAEKAIADAPGLNTEARELLLSTAMQRWHGEAFQEFSARPWARHERARIAHLRAAGLEALAQARLELGRPKEVLNLLDAHVVEHPWREEGWRLLALALYRVDRQGDAIAVLTHARSTLLEGLGLEPGDRLTELERSIRCHDPALDIEDDSILVRTAVASARTGSRSQLESLTVLLPLLAASGSVEFAGEQRLSAILAAEQLGDPELSARVIGGFDVPGSWSRSDDPALSASIALAALGALSALPPGASERVRARLLATVAMESRGTAGRLKEAAQAEEIARRLGDPALLCFALSARYLQTFKTTGYARVREVLGSEIIALAVAAELPTFEIEGRLIRMQALCALGTIDAAAKEADCIDALATRFDRPLASVFTSWFRWTFVAGPPPSEGQEMPGFRVGLPELEALTRAIRTANELPDGEFGPYEPWVRPLLLARKGPHEEALAALDGFPEPPQDLLLEVSWFLIALAAIEAGHPKAGQRALTALLPATEEYASGSGAVDLGPIAPLLRKLAEFLRITI